MKRCFSPAACSLSPHIALHEAGLAFETERVDLETEKTASGEDFARSELRRHAARRVPEPAGLHGPGGGASGRPGVQAALEAEGLMK
jgi:hypothetical protein